MIAFCVISAAGMLLIALSPAYTDGDTISTKMAGIILASLSSGGGELSFLGLTHFYGPFSLAAWGSGTGAAGLIGAGAYAVATTALKLPVKSVLFASSFLPVVMLISFFAVLPLGPLKRNSQYTIISSPAGADDILAGEEEEPEESAAMERDDEGLLASGGKVTSEESTHSAFAAFKANLLRSRSLFFPL